MCENNPAIKCNCSMTTCERHGKCCECVANHVGKNNFPACFFSEEAEAKGRSFEILLEDRGVRIVG